MPLGGALIGGGVALGGLAANLIGQSQQRKAAEKAAQQQRAISLDTMNKQLEALYQSQAPRITPQQEARIRALEEESRPVSLAENPQFQADRARLLTGGASELAGVANLQRAGGIQRGGFRNVGSLQDVQDRLGVALAGLGQQARSEQERKRDLAAELRQQADDSAREFENSRIQAYQAIVAGDAQSAIAALQGAAQARQQQSQALASLGGQVLGIGGTLAGNALQQQQLAQQQQMQNMLLMQQIFGGNRLTGLPAQQFPGAIG